MQVEEQIDRIDYRTYLAGSFQFARASRRIVQHRARPHAVEIFVDEARGVGLGRIESPVGCNIREGERKSPATWPQLRAQQRIDHDRAAYLVAMRERIDHHMRA